MSGLAQMSLLGEPDPTPAPVPTRMSEPKPLTERQQSALDTLTAAGQAGASADEVGAAWCEVRGKHDAGERCQFDGIGGRDVLRALRRKRLVKQRRDGSGTWVALGLPSENDFGDIPY